MPDYEWRDSSVDDFKKYISEGYTVRGVVSYGLVWGVPGKDYIQLQSPQKFGDGTGKYSIVGFALKPGISEQDYRQYYKEISQQKYIPKASDFPEKQPDEGAYAAARAARDQRASGLPSAQQKFYQPSKIEQQQASSSKTFPGTVPYITTKETYKTGLEVTPSGLMQQYGERFPQFKKEYSDKGISVLPAYRKESQTAIRISTKPGEGIKASELLSYYKGKMPSQVTGMGMQTGITGFPKNTGIYKQTAKFQAGGTKEVGSSIPRGAEAQLFSLKETKLGSIEAEGGWGGMKNWAKSLFAEAKGTKGTTSFGIKETTTYLGKEVIMTTGIMGKDIIQGTLGALTYKPKSLTPKKTGAEILFGKTKLGEFSTELSTFSRSATKEQMISAGVFWATLPLAAYARAGSLGAKVALSAETGFFAGMTAAGFYTKPSGKTFAPALLASIPAYETVYKPAKTFIKALPREYLPLERIARPEQVLSPTTIPRTRMSAPEYIAEYYKGKYSLTKPVPVRGYARTIPTYENVLENVRYKIGYGKVLATTNVKVKPYTKLGYQLWHASPEPITGRIVGQGSSASPGLYTDIGVSTYFLKALSEKQPKFSLFGTSGQPTIQGFIPTSVEMIPKGYLLFAETHAFPSKALRSEGLIGAGGQKNVILKGAARNRAVREMNKYLNRPFQPGALIDKEAKMLYGKGFVGSGKAVVSPEFMVGKGEPEFITAQESKYVKLKSSMRSFLQKLSGGRYYTEVGGQIVFIDEYKMLKPKAYSTLSEGGKDLVTKEMEQAKRVRESSSRYAYERSTGVLEFYERPQKFSYSAEKLVSYKAPVSYGVGKQGYFSGVEKYVSPKVSYGGIRATNIQRMGFAYDKGFTYPGLGRGGYVVPVYTYPSKVPSYVFGRGSGRTYVTSFPGRIPTTFVKKGGLGLKVWSSLGKLKIKRELNYNPSVVGVETKVKVRKPLRDLTGLEVRGVVM